MRYAPFALAGSNRPGCVVVACLLLSAAVTAGCAGSGRNAVQATELPLVHATTTATQEPRGVRHVVEAGQTLWRIASVYDVPLDELAQVNGIVDPASLSIGQSLVVPRATTVLDVPPYPAALTGGSASVVPGAAPSHFELPVAGGRILSGYGAPRSGRQHQGIDIAGKHGQPVRAAQSGRVVYSGSTLRGYGKTIVIDHGSDVQSLYAHNSDLLAREGDRVARGQVIARVGRTGNASAEHCHFEVRRNDVPVDPRPFLKPATESNR
jgi:murein DD-endopeptidase MepM/ murein hydrolase activator NlpD